MPALWTRPAWKLILGRDKRVKEHIKQTDAETKAAIAAAKKEAEEVKKAHELAQKEQSGEISANSSVKLAGLEGQRADLENQKGQDSAPGAELQRLEAVREVDRQIVQLNTQTALANAALYRDDPVKFKELINKEVDINAAGQRRIAKDTAEINKQVQKQLTAALNDIGNDFTKNLNKWISGQESFSKAMRNAWRDMAMSAVQALERIIQEQLVAMAVQAAMKALGLTTVTPQAAAQKQIQANAAVARSEAAKGAATEFADSLASNGGNIPAALEAAGIALAIGGAFAGMASISAMSGADLPNQNTLGFLHPREMVLPQSHADVIRGLAASGGARTSSSNVNVGSVNYRGAQMTDKHFGQMVKRLQRNANN